MYEMAKIHGMAGFETPPFLGTVFVKPESEIEKDLNDLDPFLDRVSLLRTHLPTEVWTVPIPPSMWTAVRLRIYLAAGPSWRANGTGKQYFTAPAARS